MEYYSPKTIEDLVKIVAKYKDSAAVIAGCTDALVKPGFFKNKKAIIETVSISELCSIEDKGATIRIGAGVTFSDIINSELIKKNNKALYSAAKVCGSLQIRNRATVAGNVINASPAADSIPALMVSNAKLTLASETGEETLSIKEFFTGPGRTKLKPGQVLAFIEFDKDSADTISFYRKIGTRKALSIAKASVAFKAKKANGALSCVDFAYGSVGPTVICSQDAKSYLEGKPLNEKNIEEVSLKAYNEVTPIDDIRSTADYRKLVVKNVIIEELKQFS